MHVNFREMLTSFCEGKAPVLPAGAPIWRPSPCVMEVDASSSILHETHPFHEIDAYKKLKEEIRVATGVVHSSMTGLGFESPPRCGRASEDVKGTRAAQPSGATTPTDSLLQ